MYQTKKYYYKAYQTSNYIKSCKNIFSQMHKIALKKTTFFAMKLGSAASWFLRPD